MILTHCDNKNHKFPDILITKERFYSSFLQASKTNLEAALAPKSIHLVGREYHVLFCEHKTMQKNPYSERCTLCHNIITKITHKTHSQHSRYCLGGLRCPTEPSGSQGRCVPAGGQPGAHPHGAGSRPCCRMQWECAGHRGSSGCLSHPVPSHATTQAGMEHGCGAAWAPRAVAAMATHPGARGIRRAH